MSENVIDLKRVGKRIRELRSALHYTQEQFSSLLYISTSYLALLETGKRTASIDILAKIAHVCHVSMDFLLFGPDVARDNRNVQLFQELFSKYSEQEVASAFSAALKYTVNYMLQADDSYLIETLQNSDYERRLLSLFKALNESSQKEVIEFARFKRERQWKAE